MPIDLNADFGEGFGRWRLDGAEDVLRLVSSVSIACGFHAGDPVVIRESIAAALRHGVAIGAHPSYPDLQGFGRREMALSPDDIEAAVVYQVGALAGACRAAGTRLRFVKPHGALYNRAADDPRAALAIARAVKGVDPSLVLLGLAGSELIAAARHLGLAEVGEAFADRGYTAMGRLVPRGQPGALLTDPGRAADRAVRLVRTGEIDVAEGGTLRIEAGSLCVHGDGAEAVTLLRGIRARFDAEAIAVQPFAA